MKKMTVADVRRKLAPGVEFEARYLGIRQRGREIDRPARRRVVKNTTYEIVTLHLDGVNEGKEISLLWKGVKAEEDHGKIVLSCEEIGAFLEITVILRPAEAMAS